MIAPLPPHCTSLTRTFPQRCRVAPHGAASARGVSRAGSTARSHRTCLPRHIPFLPLEHSPAPPPPQPHAAAAAGSAGQDGRAAGCPGAAHRRAPAAARVATTRQFCFACTAAAALSRAVLSPTPVPPSLAGVLHPRAQRGLAGGAPDAVRAAEGGGGVAGARRGRRGRRDHRRGAQRAGPHAAHARLHILPVRALCRAWLLLGAPQADAALTEQALVFSVSPRRTSFAAAGTRRATPRAPPPRTPSSPQPRASCWPRTRRR